jgi:FxsC-like protein
VTGTEHSRGSYFMLSYAHSPPLTSHRPGELDQWVRRFFDDLDTAVAERRSADSGLEGGFCDQVIPLGSDWKAALTRALRTAEVFVPLYSEAYFSRTQSGREWECFYRRMFRAGILDPKERFVPVIWTPLLQEQHRAWAREAPRFEGSPEYADNGLQALLRLKVYASTYRTVVDELAERIVAIAEGSPVGPSRVDDLDRLDSPFQPEAASALFAVTVAAPTIASVPAERAAASYGTQGPEWRPFPDDHELSLASYAKIVAERLDFAVVVTGLEKPGDDLNSKPGVVLIDPWFVAAKGGASKLRAFIRHRRSWVLPVIVVDSPDDKRTADLAQQARDILKDAEVKHSDAALRTVPKICSFQEFVSEIPFLITEAERQYLRHGPLQHPVSTGPAPRPRLTRDPKAVPGEDTDA